MRKIFEPKNNIGAGNNMSLLGPRTLKMLKNIKGNSWSRNTIHTLGCYSDYNLVSKLTVLL